MYGVVSAEILPSTLNASTRSVIGNITFDISYSSEKQEITEKQSFPEVWKILATPILHQYATAKGQISSVPIKYLNTSNDKRNTVTAVRRRACTNELTSFLAREIDTMKKTAKHKQPYSRIIILERIYKIDGINDIQQNTDNIKTKKKTTRQKLVKILNRFKENDLISGHTFHKKVHGKSLTFHSVEIHLPQ